MKKQILNLGKVLNKIEQKEINGGRGNYCCDPNYECCELGYGDCQFIQSSGNYCI